MYLIFIILGCTLIGFGTHSALIGVGVFLVCFTTLVKINDNLTIAVQHLHKNQQTIYEEIRKVR